MTLPIEPMLGEFGFAPDVCEICFYEDWFHSPTCVLNPAFDAYNIAPDMNFEVETDMNMDFEPDILEDDDGNV